MPYARSQSTANGSKPKPRIHNQKSRNWPASKNSCVMTKTVPIAEHSRNSRMANQRGKIFKTVGLRWVPTGMIFTSSTTKVDCEPPHGSNDDITNQKDFGLVAEKMISEKAGLQGIFIDAKSYALSWKPCQGDSLNLPDHRIHKDGDGDASFQLKSDSLPHAHAQTTKTFHKHQDSRIMKAQELKTKTSAQTLIYKIFLQRYQVYQGRLLASFQDDAKYEYVGQDTRSQVTESPKAAKATKSKTAKQTNPSAPKASKVTKPSKPTPTTTEPSKKDQSKKCKLVKETSNAPSLAKRSKACKVIKQQKPKSPLQLVDEFVNEDVPEQEPIYGDEEADIQRAGKGKEKRHTPTSTEPSGHAKSPSLYAELGLTDSETESDEEVSPEINAGTQDEGQAGPNPGEQVEGQAGPNPGIQNEGHAGSNPSDAEESHPQSSHVVHVGPNLEHMDFEVTNASTQQNPEQMDEEFTTTAYLSVQENLKLPTEDQVILEEPASSVRTLSSLQNLDNELSFTNQFLMEKSQEDEPNKSNTEAEVQSMVTVPIHQDTSSVPPMTTPVIDLTMMQSDSPLLKSTATTSIITTTTTITIQPTPQPQQSTTDLILVRRIGELEEHMADLLQDNLSLGERLDKHGTRLYNLEKLDIHHKVCQDVDEIVTDAVDWAMQAPLRAHFRDLPTVDMKEILQQRMFKDDSYKANNVHKDLYEALQKSLELDYSNQRLADQEEARKKRRKTRDAPRSPPGSPPSQPLPLPPPAGASSAPSTSVASGSSQLLPPPPPPSSGTSGSTLQLGRKVPSSSKTIASAQQSMAWTTSDTRYELTGIAGAQELMNIIE
ncbi:hypothetical protein Tco_0941274 [Tanacetum coccineum]|uniref:Uncharacterized protein n=1 Tax=Tanacetum coccineum TaxID=301880 RepID=A0ABQ5DX33_9ASTR